MAKNKQKTSPAYDKNTITEHVTPDEAKLRELASEFTDDKYVPPITEEHNWDRQPEMKVPAIMRKTYPDRAWVWKSRENILQAGTLHSRGGMFIIANGANCSAALEKMGYDPFTHHGAMGSKTGQNILCFTNAKLKYAHDAKIAMDSDRRSKKMQEEHPIIDPKTGQTRAVVAPTTEKNEGHVAFAQVEPRITNGPNVGDDAELVKAPEQDFGN